MLKKYVPDIGKEGMARIMLRGPGIEGRTGDGINMAKAIGADLAGMDTIAGNSPTLNMNPSSSSLTVLNGSKSPGLH